MATQLLGLRCVGLTIKALTCDTVKKAEYVERNSQRAIKHAEYEESQKQLESSTDAIANHLMHKNSETSPAFRQGDCPNVKTTIILSAPGRAEEKAGRPAAGRTGKILQKAIEIFHEKSPDTFPSKNLDDYTIVNAVGDVHYKGKTGRTEGSNREICDKENIERLVEIISGSEYVVALGDKAQLAILETGFDGGTYIGGHPSLQALNKKFSSDKQTPHERSSDRIGQWANSVLDSLKNQEINSPDMES